MAWCRLRRAAVMVTAGPGSEPGCAEALMEVADVL